MSPKSAARPCLWKKVLLNPLSSSSFDANPTQKHRCQNCSPDSDRDCACSKYIQDPTPAV